MVLNQGWFCSPGRHFWLSHWSGSTSISWVEAKDAAGSILQCTGQPPTKRTIWPTMSIVLRNPVLEWMPPGWLFQMSGTTPGCLQHKQLLFMLATRMLNYETAHLWVARPDDNLVLPSISITDGNFTPNAYVSIREVEGADDKTDLPLYWAAQTRIWILTRPLILCCREHISWPLWVFRMPPNVKFDPFVVIIKENSVQPLVVHGRCSVPIFLGCSKHFL